MKIKIRIKESLVVPVISKTSKNSPSFMKELRFLKLLFELFSKIKLKIIIIHQNKVFQFLIIVVKSSPPNYAIDPSTTI
jgi:hypothetical protein